MAGRVPYLGSPGSTSGGRTPYLGPASTTGGRTPYLGGSTKPSGGGGGLLGSIAKYSGAQFVGNLAKDIGQTAVGLGPGLYNVGKAGAKDFASTFTNPLHPSSHLLKDVIVPAAKAEKQYYTAPGLGHRLYTHPLQPILDAATIASLGAGAAAKAGLLSSEREALLTRSPRAIATGQGPVTRDISATAPLQRAAQVGLGKLRARHPEGVRIGGVRVTGGEVKRYGKQIQAAAQRHALGHLQGFGPYQQATRRLNPQEWAALHVRALDIHPDDLKALWGNSPAGKIVSDPTVRKLALEPTPKLLKAEDAARTLSTQGADLYKGIGKLKEPTAEARLTLTKDKASEALNRPVRDIHGDPYYFPHTREPGPPVSPLAQAGGGRGVPRKLGSMKQSEGALALGGKLHLRGDVLGPEFLRRVKYVKYDEIHNALLRGGVKMSKQQLEAQGGLPKGWAYIREKAGQTIPVGVRGETEQHVPIDQLIPNPEQLGSSKLSEGFTTTDPATAHVTGKGGYTIVPEHMVKAAAGEFTRSGAFERQFISKPLSVWRAVVLGLRPGFLTNNLIGNSIMYGARTAGRGAIRDLFGAIMETHGRETALKALKSAATPPELRNDLYREFFPEQVQGTFGRTQSPSTSPAHLAGQRVAEGFRTATGALPKLTSKVAEEYPRRALIRNMIRNSPEFRQVYSQLPRQTRTFETAARQLLEGKAGPEYQRLISRQVNQALGDYLNLSPFERNVLRNLLPFYSWYRAIATTTFHLAAQTPLRANILGQLGRIGLEHSQANLPSFLQGAIPLGPGPQGTQRALGTQGLNPYATLTQLARGGTSDIGSLGLNPFLMAGLQTYAAAAQKQHSYLPSVAPGAFVGQTAKSVVGSLPPSQLLFPPKPSKLYPTRSRKSVLLSQLGIPIKEYNPAVAAQQAAQGR